MARWEPNTRARLERAALDLFVEQGYDATTVAQIVERAGLTKSTFFRQFADKREVLFGGQELLAGLFCKAILDAPPGTTTVGLLAAALESVATVFTPERRSLALQRQAVIEANSDLQERSLLKRARLSGALAGALRERGLEETTALLAAEMGSLAFFTAFARWIVPANSESFVAVVRSTLHELQVGASTLT